MALTKEVIKEMHFITGRKVTIHRRLVLFSLLLIASILTGLQGGSAAFGWTGYGTGWDTFDTLLGTFDMAVWVYYDNNGTNSVDLDEASQHIDNTGDFDVTCGRAEVTEGDGSMPTVDFEFFDPVIEPNDYHIGHYDLEQSTYDKYPSLGAFVMVETMASIPGNCFGAGSWNVFFPSSGAIYDDSST
jgi:hypothetical protein